MSALAGTTTPVVGAQAAPLHAGGLPPSADLPSAPVLPLTPPSPHTIPAANASEGVAPKAPALVRLQASRLRLRDAMMPPPPEPEPVVPPPPMNSAQRFLHQIRGLPVVGDISAAFEAWWHSHPLRPVAQAAGKASQRAVEPLAQSHPWWLVIGSALFGALLIVARPWRLALRSALFAGMLPQLLSQLVRRMPIGTWITLFGTLFAGASNAGKPPPTAARTPSPPAGTGTGTGGATIPVPPASAMPGGMP